MNRLAVDILQLSTILSPSSFVPRHSPLFILYSSSFLSHSSFLIINFFNERTAALMLLSLKVIPLCLNFSVQFQFGVAFRKDKT